MLYLVPLQATAQALELPLTNGYVTTVVLTLLLVVTGSKKFLSEMETGLNNIKSFKGYFL
jgi:hypothetical protein